MIAIINIEIFCDHIFAILNMRKKSLTNLDVGGGYYSLQLTGSIDINTDT